MILILAVFGFSLFDYLGYNLLGTKKLVLYRVIQTIVQVGIIALLFLHSWLIALCFVLLWWTWCCDWFYYIIDFLSQKIFGISFEGGDSLESVFLGITTVSWASWTPYGLINLLINKTKIVGNVVLITQSLIGIAILLIIEGVL